MTFKEYMESLKDSSLEELRKKLIKSGAKNV